MSPGQFWIVRRGVIGLSTLSLDGESTILGLAVQSNWFGLPLTLVQPYYATTFTSSSLIKVARTEVRGSPLLTQQLLENTQYRLQQAELMLCVLSQNRTDKRLRQFLSFLGQEFGELSGQGIRIPFGLTHQQIANILCSSRVTITRLLSQLRHEGYLTMQGKIMILRDF